MKRWFGFAWVALIACSGAFAQVWFLINIGVISRVKRFDPYRLFCWQWWSLSRV